MPAQSWAGCFPAAEGCSGAGPAGQTRLGFAEEVKACIWDCKMDKGHEQEKSGKTGVWGPSLPKLCEDAFG